MHEGLQKKYDTILWRLSATLFCLLMVSSVFIRLFVLGTEIPIKDIMSVPVFIILLTGALLATVLLIIFPFQFYIYAVFCCLWGLLRIMDGGSVAGLCGYLLGCAFAARQGFFKVHQKIKIGIVFLVLCVAIATQYRYGLALLARNLLLCFEFSLLAAVSLLLAWPQIQKLRATQKESVLKLPTSEFKPRDVTILQRILEGKKYDAVANECAISVHTLKHEVRALFQKLKISDRTTFLSTYAGHTILLQGVDATPPVTEGSSA
jgi:DNA-binding CsgD family transcriptional regulator